MRAWLPIVLTLPFALAGCPAMLSDWTISGSGAADASTDTSSGGGGASSGSGGSSGSSSGGSSSGGSGGATGGSPSTGGGPSTGGASNSGGTTGTGGTSAGGVTGTGGVTGSSPPSCAGLAATCGPSGNEDCCAIPLVTGGTYNRSNDASYPATVSDFRLDTYEITVGRFRKFVAAYSQGMIAAGAGKNPNNASDPGWDTTWNTSLPVDATALTTAVQCNAKYQTWTPSAGSNENKPMNCIDWYEANAFCIWDGGRLPTEAEWNYAAAGGTDQRVYPWGATAPDCTYANFGGTSFPSTACVVPGTGSTNNVGAESPKGNGKYGQADLAGNVGEWTLDWYADPYSQIFCTNCADTAAASASSSQPFRIVRGGSFTEVASDLLLSFRADYRPSDRVFTLGSRCARSAP